MVNVYENVQPSHSTNNCAFSKIYFSNNSLIMHNCLFLGVKISYLSNGIISQEKECYCLSKVSLEASFTYENFGRRFFN